MKLSWQNVKNYFKDSASAFAVIIAIFSLIISIISITFSHSQAEFEKDVARRKFIIETLKEMKETQEELKEIRSRIAGKNNLSEKEILLLNYYDVLSKTLADNIDFNTEEKLFTRAQCYHEHSVRLRKNPSNKSTQVGGVAGKEEVVVLGKFYYNPQDVWYYIITPAKKIGWAYKYFKILE